jgi:hypothetical protein
VLPHCSSYPSPVTGTSEYTILNYLLPDRHVAETAKDVALIPGAHAMTRLLWASNSIRGNLSFITPDLGQPAQRAVPVHTSLGDARQRCPSNATSISPTESSCSKRTPNSNPASRSPCYMSGKCASSLPVSSCAGISYQSAGVSLLCFSPSSSEPSVIPALLHRFLDPLCVFFAIILVQVTGFDVRWGSGVGVVEKAGPTR